MLKNFDDCFRDTNLDKNIIEDFRNLLISRKKLKSWPLTNYDIISFCSLNLEVNLIEKLNEKEVNIDINHQLMVVCQHWQDQ